MKTRLLKATIHWFDKYGESGLHVFTVRSKTEPTEDELDALNIHAQQCSHAHDCCGCWFSSYAQIRRHNKRNEWHVTQRFGRNV